MSILLINFQLKLMKYNKNHNGVFNLLYWQSFPTKSHVGFSLEEKYYHRVNITLNKDGKHFLEFLHLFDIAQSVIYDVIPQ